MTKELIRHNRPVSDHLHPLVYKAMAGLALWFALSAWVFFGDTSYTALVLAVVSLFLFITVAIPFAIWLAWRGSPASGAPADSQSFREWASGEFETWQCRVSGREAAVEILLPLMAVAFGLFVFGLATHAGRCCRKAWTAERAARPSSDRQRAPCRPPRWRSRSAGRG